MPEAQPIIKIENITKKYQMGTVEVAALNGVSMEIKPGEFLAIMGQSGSGKSTLMNILGCLDRPTSGEYYLDSEDVSYFDREELALVRNQKIGFVFQSYNLLPRTSAIENVSLPMIYDRRLSRTSEEIQERAASLLGKVGLSERMEHMPHEMSGGQQQRVAIARALVNDPVLLLADEPTGNLDSASGDEIMQILAELHRQGSTIVMVTHEPEIAEYAQRVVKFLDGKIETDHQNGKGKRG